MIWQTLSEWFGGRPAGEAVFKEEWIALLEANVPLYSRLPEELQTRLHERIAQFIARTRFQACGDLELTEEMILTIAAQACLLVIHREGPPYPDLTDVYLYPTTFSSVQRSSDATGVVTETFFEKPKQLHQKRPDLYEELKHYYGLDPQQWFS